MAVTAGCTLAACGHIRFADEKDMDVGVKYYVPKPYVLVSRTGAKDKPIDVQVIYVPDLSKPQHAKPIAGLGSSDLSLTLSNGMLVSFGQKSDPKLAEMLTSVGGLATSLASAQKTKAEARAVEQGLDIRDGNALITISKNIEKVVSAPLLDKWLTTGEKGALHSAIAELATIGGAIVRPGGTPPDSEAVVARLEGVLKNWDRVRTSTESPDLKSLVETLATLKEELKAIVARAKPKATDPPTVTLYEIDNSTGTTILREVVPPPGIDK